VAVGRLVRFDDVRGYGFIAQAGGGEDVFVHANDLGEQRHLFRPGVRVAYDVEEGERGPKVSSIRVLDDDLSDPTPRTTGSAGRARASTGDDDMCDVLGVGELTSAVTDVLLENVPELTGKQILEIRRHVVNLCRSHGWVEG
jgi:cold shock CspA family protein